MPPKKKSVVKPTIAKGEKKPKGKEKKKIIGPRTGNGTIDGPYCYNDFYKTKTAYDFAVADAKAMAIKEANSTGSVE